MRPRPRASAERAHQAQAPGGDALYLEHLAGEADEDEDAVATDDVASSSRDPSSSAAMEGIGAKLASALLEAQDELLERELEEAVAEERAADAFDSEACADGDAGRATCPVARPETPEETLKERDPRDPHRARAPGGGGGGRRASRERPRRARSVGKARQPRAHAPARRPRCAAATDPSSPRRKGGGVARGGLAVRKQRAVPRAAGGAAGEKREREELVVALAAEVARAVETSLTPPRVGPARCSCSCPAGTRSKRS